MGLWEIGNAKENLKKALGKYGPDGDKIKEEYEILVKEAGAEKAHEILVKEVGAEKAREILFRKGSVEKAEKSGLQTETEIEQNNIIVTTGDIKKDYDIIGPVYFQVSNKGIFSSPLSELLKKYKDKIVAMKTEGMLPKEKMDWGFLYGEFSVDKGQNQFDQAFYIAVEELKKRAAILKADAIISMRQDIDLDTTGFQFFYLQMYGTAIKFK